MSAFVEDGWEFSVRKLDPSAAPRLSLYSPSFDPSAAPWLDPFYPKKEPVFTCEFEYSIKHLESGVEFGFCASDALSKFYDEKTHFRRYLLSRRHSSLLPIYKYPPHRAYGSPLLPAGGYDSAYVGRMRINQYEDVNSYAWEDIDLETLHEQIVWATENQKISAGPYTEFFNPDDAPARLKKGIIKKKSQCKESEEGLVHPILNYAAPLYSDHGFTVDGFASCHFHLVVIGSGWFVCVRQVYCKRNGARREREMTMQCNFKRNTIYREIIERQSKRFNERCEKDWAGVRVVFYEAKQLKIREMMMRPNPFTFPPATKRIALSEGTLEKAPVEAMDVSDYKVESLFTNCGEQLKFLEAETGTRIQIIPLFRHPCKPIISESMMYILGLPGKAPTTAYIRGLEKNLDYAKSHLKKLLSRKRQNLVEPARTTYCRQSFSQVLTEPSQNHLL